MKDIVSNRPQTVLAASREPKDLNSIKGGLAPTSTFHSLAELSLYGFIEKIEKFDPDVLIVSQVMIDEMFLNMLRDVVKFRPLPLLVFTKSSSQHLAAQAIRIGVTSFVVDGLTPRRVEALTMIAIERFKLNHALHKELQKSKEELDARKVVEQAKGLLMQTKNMSEQDAYRSLRTMAMKQSKPIKDIAEAVISLSELLP